jgi:hypothetical protein
MGSKDKVPAFSAVPEVWGIRGMLEMERER